ncbi:hypothetical protein ABT272_44180 [Streptomyces sp900105245]|uniref:Uncharacterized protein n=1 Tax=Streptomyces sp. 900105245 TaxID=3154379 RepID=A0ABV1ULC5_9ACTN
MAVFVQTKGRVLSFQSAMYALMSRSLGCAKWKMRRRKFLCVRSPNHRDEPVGVKCRRKRGCAGSHFLM